MSVNKQELQIEGRTLVVKNLDKIFYPAAGFTKGQVLDYYIRAAKYLLPHLKDRPVTLKRYPDGIGGDFFYEKNAPGYTPEWVKRFPVPRRGGGPDINYILVNDLPTLVWCANIATIEFHPFLHRVPHIDRPTETVFDLDPGEGSSVVKCAEVAFILREVLHHLKLESLPKVSGSKGIQIYVPLNTAVTYDVTRTFARTLAKLLERQHAGLIISEMAKAERKGKVFIDWSQNADFKTTVGVYSLRAKRQHPYISLPVTWDELETVLSEGASSTLYFAPDAALERCDRIGDLFAPVLKLKQRLPEDFVELLSHRSPQPKAPGPAAPRPKAKEAPAPSRQGGRRRFVVSRGDDGYDLRLDMRRGAKSWSLPEGIPNKADENRIAIPSKGRTAGQEWDTGTYEVIEGDYARGRLQLFLEGKKLNGEWLLMADGENWRLAKAGC